MEAFGPRFEAFLTSQVASQAAKSLSEGVEIEFKIESEVFYFKRLKAGNTVQMGPSAKPEVVFTLTPRAANSVLEESSTTDIGGIGVKIAKLIVSSDPNHKIWVKLHTGLLGFVAKGFLGVIATGGSAFAGFLAERGLNGLDAIKTAIRSFK